jgi:coenzyme PQQ precursor peptide PqqA
MCVPYSSPPESAVTIKIYVIHRLKVLLGEREGRQRAAPRPWPVRQADRPIADARRLPEGAVRQHLRSLKARLMNTPASTPRCIELIFVSSEGIKARVAELTRCAPHQRAQTRRRNDAMVWSTPEVREVCVGMEVTSYLSAEM